MTTSVLTPKTWAVDTETSGLLWQHGQRIHRLGCVNGNGSSVWSGFNRFDDYFYSSSCRLFSDRDLRPTRRGREKIGVRIFSSIQDRATAIVGHNLKFDAHMLRREGVELDWSKVDDTIVMAGLMADDQYKNLLHLSIWAFDYSGDEDRELHEWIAASPEKSKSNYSLIPDEKLRPYTERQLINCLILYRLWMPQIKKHFAPLYAMEKKLARTLFEMEERGVRLSVPAAKRCSDQCAVVQAKDLRKMRRIIKVKNFDPGKPTQLIPVLEAMGLDLPKTRTGRVATGIEALTPYISYPFIQALIAWRRAGKIRGTYAEGLQKRVCDDGIIRGTYNQTGARTGRLSSSDPNLQNITSRDPVYGPLVKRCFRSRIGYETYSLDYSGQELRVGFSLADDRAAIDIVLSGEDLHEQMMRRLFPDVKTYTKAHRTLAKNMNFGIFYGARTKRIARMLADARAGILTGDINYDLPPSMAGVTRDDFKEARRLLRVWFNRFRRTRDWISETTWLCEKQLWVADLYGRRYRLPPRHAYKAVNSLVQGMSANITKHAMVELDDAWRGTDNHILMQVHDELVFEVPRGNFAPILQAKAIMEAQAKDLLTLPMQVNIERWTPTWGQLRKVEVA